MKVWVLILLSVAAASPLFADDTYQIRFALCYPAKPKTSAYKVIKKTFKKTFPGTFVHKKPKGDVPYLVVSEVPIQNYTMPGIDDMVRFGEGITTQDAQKLQQPVAIVQLDYYGNPDHGFDAVKEASTAALAGAEAGGAYIWDDHTQQMFSPKAWRESRIETFAGYFPRVPKHISIHVYPDGDGYRAVTLGMSKFATHELVVESLPRTWRDQVVNLLQALAQVVAASPPRKSHGNLVLNLDMIQHPKMKAEYLADTYPNAQKLAFIQTQPGRRQDGDAPGPLLELRFPEAEGATHAERLASTLRNLFGWDEASEKGSFGDAMAARRKEILPQLARFKKVAQAGLPTGERLLIKAPFSDDTAKKREWMWVEVITWDNSGVTGILVNQPDWIQTLQVGSKVKVAEVDIHDILHEPNKKE